MTVFILGPLFILKGKVVSLKSRTKQLVKCLGSEGAGFKLVGHSLAGKIPDSTKKTSKGKFLLKHTKIMVDCDQNKLRYTF